MEKILFGAAGGFFVAVQWVRLSSCAISRYYNTSMGMTLLLSANIIAVTLSCRFLLMLHTPNSLERFSFRHLSSPTCSHHCNSLLTRAPESATRPLELVECCFLSGVKPPQVFFPHNSTSLFTTLAHCCSSHPVQDSGAGQWEEPRDDWLPRHSQDPVVSHLSQGYSLSQPCIDGTNTQLKSGQQSHCPLSTSSGCTLTSHYSPYWRFIS